MARKPVVRVRRHGARAWAGLAARPRRVGPRVTCLRRLLGQSGRRNSRSCSRSRSRIPGPRPSRPHHSPHYRDHHSSHHSSHHSPRDPKDHRSRYCIRCCSRYCIRYCNFRRSPQQQHTALCCEQVSSGTVEQKGGNGRAGRADRPASVATRSELPPIACAVDSARGRRCVRREGWAVRLVVRWEHPAVDCGERGPQ